MGDERTPSNTYKLEVRGGDEDRAEQATTRGALVLHDQCSFVDETRTRPYEPRATTALLQLTLRNSYMHHQRPSRGCFPDKVFVSSTRSPRVYMFDVFFVAPAIFLRASGASEAAWACWTVDVLELG